MLVFFILRLRYLNSNMELLISLREKIIKLEAYLFKFQYGATNI